MLKLMLSLSEIKVRGVTMDAVVLGVGALSDAAMSNALRLNASGGATRSASAT